MAETYDWNSFQAALDKLQEEVRKQLREKRLAEEKQRQNGKA